ncbi:MAG: Ig-like domain-containing protein [Proteobacteria bacterium]|nr:Ig-like domain-containing protein [Pseudomonadota bacterium]MBU1715559.1 Ig-like domain-containing protein [Pseudomonadota bacterium]
MLTKKLLPKLFSLLRITFITLLLLTACTTGTDTPTQDDESTGVGGSDSLYLTSSSTTIQSDDTQSAEIMATVLDNFVPQEGVEVIFSTNGGVISTATGTTDVNGKATTILTSGPAASNDVVTVTATSLGLTNTVPVQITGNIITLTTAQTNIAVGDNPTLSVSVQNAIPLGIPNATVTFSILSGANIISLSTSQAITDVTGKSSVRLTSVASGNAIIQASCMGATTTLNMVIAAPSNVFEITSPDTDSYSLPTSPAGSLPITVNAPNQTNVTFTTTLGSWLGATSPGNTIDVPVVDGTASATLSSLAAGTATIEVRDSTNPSIIDSMNAVFSAPPADAGFIALQASATNVSVTTSGATKNTITLIATVTTGLPENNVVGGAVVNFTMDNAPGGGEYISPASAVTNDYGVATSTFYSGELSSSGSDGVKISAVVDKTTIGNNVNIIIGGVAGSISIGRANKISKNGESTLYTQMITVQATDAGGSPMANQVVSLSLWPKSYLLGYAWAWNTTGGTCGSWTGCYKYVPWPMATMYNKNTSYNYYIPNEDLNNNLILDTGEDAIPNLDNLLTPHNSTAGSVPATVTTDETGTASFEHTFLMQYALWVEVKLKATIVVAGTETQATQSWVLPAEEGDVNNCDLYNSPFGYYPQECPPQCNDGQDNDGDGLIDYGIGIDNDDGCANINDNTE